MRNIYTLQYYLFDKEKYVPRSTSHFPSYLSLPITLFYIYLHSRFHNNYLYNLYAFHWYAIVYN